MKPYRFQYQKTKGYRAPENRQCVKRPGKWGNPFPTGVEKGDSPETRKAKHAASVEKFERFLAKTIDGRELARDARRELRGFNLGCSCALDLPCHGNTLLRIANETE